MTALNITPKISTKEARFRGTVAAGERVAVTIAGGADWSDTGLKLRVINHRGKTLAVFPAPGTDDAWVVSGEDLTCTLNLNTVQMLDSVPPRAIVPFRFVLANADSDTLYFNDECSVVHWPQEEGDEVPYDLNEWPGLIDEWTAQLASMSEDLEAHKADTDTHVTEQDRALWNGKADNADLLALAHRVDALTPLSSTLAGQTINTNTQNAMRNALRIIGAALGATMRIAAICFLLPSFGASVSLAPLGDLDLDTNPMVVTNVDFSGLDVTESDPEFSSFTNSGGTIYGPLKFNREYLGYPMPYSFTTNGITFWNYTSYGGGGGYWSEVTRWWGDFLTSESDPTVPAWAKAETPPQTMRTNDVCNIVTNEVEIPGEFTAWTIFRGGVDVTSQVSQPTIDLSDPIGTALGWEIEYSHIPSDLGGGASHESHTQGGPDATSLTWNVGIWNEDLQDLDPVYYTATRQPITKNALGLARLTDLPSLTNYYTIAEAKSNLLTRAEAEAGYTRWTFSPASYNGVPFTIEKSYDPVMHVFEGWMLIWNDGDASEYVIGTEDATSLSTDINLGLDTVHVTATRHRITPTATSQLTNDSGFVAATITNGLASAESVSAVATTNAAQSAQIAQVEQTVNTWESYWDGTNVIFEVTNYYGNTSGELPRLRIKEFRDGGWTNVWDEARKFAVCESNLLHAVSASNAACRAACSAELAEGLSTRAPLAWGVYTDKGTTNVVGNSVWMTSPETYFAGGTEYQRVAVGSGTVCVLTDNGALSKTVGEPGTFRFQDDGGTNYFGFAKSDSYTIGCRTDDISVEGTLITLRYDVIMGGNDVPIVYWREFIDSGSWVQLNNSDGTAADGSPYTVTWYQSDGSYYAAINCGENATGFFKAETSVAGDVVFETNMRFRAGGGIECTNTAANVMGVIKPVYNGSSVTWTWSVK